MTFHEADADVSDAELYAIGGRQKHATDATKGAASISRQNQSGFALEKRTLLTFACNSHFPSFFLSLKSETRK